jgi:signal transduction histidine kinase
MKNNALLITLLTLLFTNLLLSQACQGQTEHTETLKIQEVVFTESTQEKIPNVSSNSKRISLPFSVTQNKENIKHKYYWFKFNFEQEQAFLRPAIYFPRYQFDLDVYFNNKRIGGTNTPEGKQALGWNHPLLIEIQPANISSDNNQIIVRVASGAPTTLLSNIYIGEYKQLNTLLQKTTLLYRDASQISIFLCIFSSLISFIIWVYRKQDKQYLIFSLFSLAWVLPITSAYLPYSPIEHENWLRLIFISIDLSALLLFLLVNKILDLQLKRLAKTLVGVTILSALALFLLPAEYTMKIAVLMDAIKICSLIVAFVYALPKIRSLKKEEAIWVVSGLSFVVPILIHDLYPYTTSQLGESYYNSITYSQLIAPLFLALSLLYLVRKFVGALNNSETNNLELEYRVNKNTQALEKTYQEKREIELRDAEHQEKQRIYKDLHDDIGSKLVSIIHAADKDSSEEIARSALEYLRDSVTQVQNIHADIDEIISKIIEESKVRSIAAGLEISVNHNLHELLPNQTSSPNLGYHLSRIIREGITNIIKHSCANYIKLDINITSDSLILRLSDNGKNFIPSIKQGVGIANMKYRADELEGTVTWTNNLQGGCEVELKLPLFEYA